MACAEPRLTALKVAFKGEIHRLRVDLNSFHFVDLTALFKETFHLQEGSFVIQYSDQEGDCLNVTSDAEYVEACRVFLNGADTVKSLRFVAVTRTQVVFQEHVADPILKAIEKLVETLNAAMEKVKQEQWAQRAQTGIDHTGEAIKSVAKDARESFTAARQSFQEIPFDQYVKDTTETLKSAAEGISDFAKEVVGEIKSYRVPPTPAPAAEAEAVVETVEIAQPAPATSVSDSEWEEVAEQTEIAVPVAEEAPVMVAAEPEVVQVAAPVVSEAEQKWAAQLRMVNDIFPGVESSRVIERLEQCNGNVEVVVNALMEEM